MFGLARLSINHNLKSNMLSHYVKERQGKGRRLSRKGLTAGVSNLKERAHERKVYSVAKSASRPDCMGEIGRVSCAIHQLGMTGVIITN